MNSDMSGRKSGTRSRSAEERCSTVWRRGKSPSLCSFTGEGLGAECVFTYLIQTLERTRTNYRPLVEG